MRPLLACLTLSLLAPVAFADGPEAPVAPAPAPRGGGMSASAPRLAPVVLDEITQKCAPLAKPAAVPDVPRALSARISLASCLAEARIGVLSLIDGQESVLALEEATAPAFALLDDAIDLGDAGLQISALRAKADLYVRMATTMIGTVPPPANTTPEAAALRETRREIVEGMVAPWRDRIRAAREAVVALGKKHPELAKNPVARTAIEKSARELAQQIAGT